MSDVPPEIEAYLAGLDASTWDALCRRVRPPEEHPSPKIRATAALRTHCDELTESRLGFIQPGSAPSDKANAVAALRGLFGAS